MLSDGPTKPVSAMMELVKLNDRHVDDDRSATIRTINKFIPNRNNFMEIFSKSGRFVGSNNDPMSQSPGVSLTR